MAELAAEFTELFRAEHREVRDRLLDLVEAFRRRDGEQASALAAEVVRLTGPHFRYEEEALYPALVDLFGPEYVEKLLADHDQAIEHARHIGRLAETEVPTDAEVVEATTRVRAILPHVSDCDGLSIMVEVVPEESVRAVLRARTRARADDLDLLTWASTLRERSAVAA